MTKPLHHILQPLCMRFEEFGEFLKTPGSLAELDNGRDEIHHQDDKGNGD